jgi:ABC-type spermidine/putrescine transport system permease subunit II
MGVLRPRINGQTLTTLAILLIVGFLVILPMIFLVEESLNVGDPMAFPPVEFGLANYISIFQEDFKTVWNTVVIAVMATVMAIIIGFALAWILTRTNVPGREKLERLMELPYYMTPLVGALAWAVIAGPKSGFINQIWKAFGGTNDIADIYTHFGIAWVMALFEGTVAFVMISASMKSMDPALEESARVMGASKFRTMLDRDLAAGDAGRDGSVAVRLCRDAWFVCRGPRARHSRTHLCHHHRHLGLHACLSAGLRPSLGHGPFAVHRHVRHAEPVSPHDPPRHLYDHQRQGVPATADGYGPHGLGAVQHLRPLCGAGGGVPDCRTPHDLAAALRNRDPEPGAVDPRQLPAGAVARSGAHGDCSTASCWAWASPRWAW